jgi:hypothetical protein
MSAYNYKMFYIKYAILYIYLICREREGKSNLYSLKFLTQIRDTGNSSKNEIFHELIVSKNALNFVLENDHDIHYCRSFKGEVCSIMR